MTTNPDSPAPTTADALLEAELPGWAPRPDPLHPLDPATTTVSSSTTFPPMTAGESPAGDVDEDLDDRADWSEPQPPKPAATSPRSAGELERELTIASGAAQLFALIASVASLVLDATIGKSSRAYVMQPGEAQAIAEPLGRIAARHAPIGDGDVGDIGDGIQAGVATTAYVARATIQHHSGAEIPQPGAPS